MTAIEAYTFIGLAFVLGALIGSGLTYWLAKDELAALREDVSDLLDATFEDNNKD